MGACEGRWWSAPTHVNHSTDLGPSARLICKQFVERKGYSVTSDYTTWATRNTGSSWIVNASMGPHVATCVRTNSGDSWEGSVVRGSL